jgi:A/G-specific adenine glycosylase
MLIVRDETGRILLQRRPPTGIWGGLWSLPEGRSRKAACENIGLDGSTTKAHERTLTEIEHRLTHVRLRITPAVVTPPPSSWLQCPELRENSDLAWFEQDAWKQLGLPRPVEELLHSLRKEEIT